MDQENKKIKMDNIIKDFLLMMQNKEKENLLIKKIEYFKEYGKIIDIMD